MIFNYTTYLSGMLYNFFMVIISILNLCLAVLVNNMLFLLVGATINKTSNKLLIVVLSIISGVICATLKLFMLPRVYLILIEIILFACSSIVLFYPQNFLSFVVMQLVVFTYILAGSGVSYLVQILYFNSFDLTYISYTIFGFVENIVLFLLGLVIMMLFKANYRKKIILDFVYKVMIEVAGKRIFLNMFLDSGNMLYDDGVSGLPILVVNKTKFESKIGLMVIEEECRTIQYTTISGEVKKLAIIEPDNIFLIVNGVYKRISALIGFVDKDFVIYDGLLHSAVA